MSFNLYKVRLLCIIRNKESIFWSFFFPIALATCFYFAFNNLWTMESFNTMKIGYVSVSEGPDYLKEALEQAKINDTKMFEITYCNNEEASKLLDENKVKAYIIGGEAPEMIVKDSALYETILKSFLDSYSRVMITAQTIVEANPEAMSQGLMVELMRQDTFVQEVTDENKPDEILIFFYALMALTCLYAVNGGLEEVINIQADQSLRGARLNVAPIHKMKLFLSNLMAAYTVHLLSILLLFIYMNYILGVKFGDNLLYISIICLIGSITGLLLGATVGVWVKKKTNVKGAILSTIVMVGSFLSGMMSTDVKYIVDTKMPILSYINPVNLVSDSLYRLYYYDTYERLYLNLAILSVMGIGMGVLSYLGIRRRTYASI